MIIIMQHGSSQKDIDYVVSRAQSLGLATHVSQDQGQTFINLIGDLRAIYPSALSGLHGVERVVTLDQPFRLASKDFKSERTVVTVGDIAIGSEQVVVIAGPCAVETREQLMRTARAVKDAGAQMLRGGAFKPRTSPYSFQGLGEEGLKILAEAREVTGLYIVTEVMTPEQIPLVARYADVLQIGARNTLNYSLLHAVGETDKPVLLKRGMMSTVQELLMSAEYILSYGNHNVVLCERGIRTFETYTRNTLDINAVPLLKELTHLPVLVDPSHATGKASLVNAVSRASVAAGADGLLIEVHIDPENALSDGYQSLNPRQFAELMGDIERVAQAVGRYTTPEKQLVK
ncbi:MAG: 3-deoxy-7-phosphoheptulonate synthase [Chloroflexi bacterium RBG_16_52_11]|nr:MAG: 3-deoxy-7-phosphoheptulonate synthase [Chloroflexi bacterium RBG_16_52_11]